MEAKLLEGKAIAEKLQKNHIAEVEKLKKVTARTPSILAIQVRESREFESYLKSQKRVAELVGVNHEVKRILGANEQELIKGIQQANQNSGVHGIMVQMPLPKEFNLEIVLDSIDRNKDVEGITSYSLGQLILKKFNLIPSTAFSCITLVTETGMNPYGKEAVVVGSSKIVGTPAAILLNNFMATTTMCHVATAEAGKLEEHVNRADILIVAVGKPNVIPGKWIKEGAVVIDAGINHMDGKIVGDVEFEEAKKRASFITPVPGGVGPLTTTLLMRNLIIAFKIQHSLR